MFRNPSGIFALGFYVLVLILTIFSVQIAGNNPLGIVGPALKPPSDQFIFGTDNFGRNVFAMTVYGIRTTAYVALASTILTSVLGIILGALAGYLGGITDLVIMRVVETVLLLPRQVFVLLVVFILGANFTIIILAIAITGWPSILTITRAEFLSYREQQFIESAKAIGETRFSIMFREILPNTLPALITSIFVQISLTAILEATLGFFNLTDPNVPSIGLLLSNARLYLQTAPWMTLIPGLLLTLFIMSSNIVSDILAESYNPKLKARGVLG